MEYHSVHGHDVASFDISSSHRLPTVTASAALEELESDQSAYVSCGLEDLDRSLSGKGHENDGGSPTRGGVKRGQVTEVWGPPGTGKTAFGLQLAANALNDGNGVVWTVSKLSQASELRVSLEPREYECLTLPHLVALLSKPTSRNIPNNIGLVVVSSVTALINSALPRPQDGKQGLNLNRGPSPLVKRKQALQSIMKGFQTLASTRNCAVVVLSQCATRMQSERGATLTPAVNANLWEQGVSTRLVLFRDWAWQSTRSRTIFLAGLQKLDGKTMPGTVEQISAFKVGRDGIASVPHDDGYHRSADLPNVTQPKRKLAQTDFEIPDSEDDEDYGWANEDEAFLPPQPQQWQGSEDILLGQELGRSEDEDGSDDEEHNHQAPGDMSAQGSSSPGGDDGEGFVAGEAPSS